MVDLETALPEEKSATYHLKLRDLLEQSAVLFARNGYHNTSIRDIAAEMNTSLAGLYYYFDTKEELLFLISKNSFDSVLHSLHEKLRADQSPAEQLQVLVQNHLHYFVTHLDSMKVLAHESEVLTGAYYQRINEKKKHYVEVVENILLDIHRASARNSRVNQEIRIAALSLFGMMNWVYTWYNPEKREHSPAHIVKIAKQMVEIFLNGFVKTKI